VPPMPRGSEPKPHRRAADDPARSRLRTAVVRDNAALAGLYGLAAMTLDVRPVSTRRELSAFIKLPWQLYRDEPNWVPPLLIELKKRLDQSRNPFFKHAEAQYFLAYRDGRAIGRISARIDENFNKFQDNRWGLFGWFECRDDPDAAQALLQAAESWLRERGRDRMVGPMDFTTNDEIGVLIAGHEYPPIILCPWHHAYYQRLFEQGLGMEKAMDLCMWSLHVTDRDKVHPAIWRMADNLESEHGIVCRNFRKNELQAEVTRFLEVYNSAWERNWGFVPLNEEEVRHYAKDLKPVLDENWAMIAEKPETGEVVGAALTLPDFNQVLAKLNGRLLPFGWITALRAKAKIDAVRVFALGVKPEYQHTGIGARFYQMHYDAAERTPQKGGEMGWILEVNEPMNRAMEGMGGEIKRRYRVYEKHL
jgi:GNAT superfamily N-acetyltransferase